MWPKLGRVRLAQSSVASEPKYSLGIVVPSLYLLNE